MTDKDKKSRRWFLRATGGTAAGVALAGCSEQDDPGADTTEPDPDMTTDIGTETETPEPETTEVYKPGSLAVEAVDDSTVELELTNPFHAALNVLAYSSFSIIPEGLVDDVEGYDGEMSYEEFSTSSPIGSGPFQFEDWSSDTEASVSRYDDYHGDVASLDGIHWQIIEDDEAAYNYSQNENSDIIAMPTAQYDPELVSVEGTDDLGRDYGTYGPMRNDATANYLAVATINSYYIGFNTDNVEKPVRQAVAYAMNQQTMVDQVFKGRGTPAYHFTPPNIYPGGAPEYTSHAEEGYPYGYNESLLDEARNAMEEAGYGEDNRYEFTFTTYESPTWQQMGGILRDQLASCHIDMQLEEAPFATLIERGLNGNLDAYSLGWIMDWPTPDNFLGLLYPPLSDTSQADAQSYTNWSGTDAAQQATEAWESVEANPAPTDEAQSAREEAYVQIEEANWEDAVFLTVYHGLEERLWYDWLDVPRFGGAGPSRQKHNHTVKDKEDSNTLNLINSTMSTLDPIAATDTASGTVIQNVFDALLNYPNGEAAVENLLVEDYEISDDYKTYTFSLKEGVTYHDGSELTADDVVYSFERLAGSPNSQRSYFILSYAMNVVHELEEVTVTETSEE